MFVSTNTLKSTFLLVIDYQKMLFEQASVGSLDHNDVLCRITDSAVVYEQIRKTLHRRMVIRAAAKSAVRSPFKRI